MINMRPLTLLPLLLFAALLFSGNPAVAQNQVPAPGRLKAQAAQNLITTLGKNLTVIDVRSPGEFAQGHVPGAILLPVEQLPAELGKIPADKPVLFVCRTGRRASHAFGLVREARPEQARIWYLDGVPRYKADGSYSFQ